MLPLVSLRSEEVIQRKLCKVFVGGCHGNDCIHMGTKFHLHVCYTEQVIGVVVMETIAYFTHEQVPSFTIEYMCVPCVLY